MGIEKTVHRVREKFYWPGYTGDIEQYVSSCPVCQERTRSSPHARAQLQHIVANKPFQLIAMDFLEMPSSKNGNKHCLVISDYFTKWPEAFALPDRQAKTVARTLITGIIARHGVPEALHSDQGREFENNLIKEMCSALGITKVRTSPYLPQSDGLVERLNRTILGILSKYVDDHPNDWDMYLDTVLAAYRTSVHNSTGFSPFQLIYGRQPRLPVDVALGSNSSHDPHLLDYTEYLNSIQRRLLHLSEEVEEQQTVSRARQAASYPENPKYSYSTGDQVGLHEPARRRGPGYKLKRSWTGPFTVVSQKGPVNYLIRRSSSSRAKTKLVHFDRLKPWRVRQTNSLSTSLSSEFTADGYSSVEHETDSSENLSFSEYGQLTAVDDEVDADDESSDGDMDSTSTPRVRSTKRGRIISLPPRFRDFIMH